MTDSRLLTAEQFAANKFELPEAGRWVELVAGRVNTFDPPDDAHGTTVLNLSKALASSLQRLGADAAGCACYELGLVTARDPDTVRCPPVSYFSGSGAFSETDKVITETRPALVVEIASTNRRRRGMRERVEEFLEWGVALVWVADPAGKQMHVFERGKGHKRLADFQSLSGSPVLDGFTIRVGELFAVPDWWR